MSCQRKNVSCGACCGIYNLDIADAKGYDKLLKQRSIKLKEISLKDRQALLAYRHRQERVEAKLRRRDPEIYVCPFLAYLDLDHKRIGCMIHPCRTGQSDSQDLSFYGASICRNYDCPNKEEDKRSYYALLLERCFSESHDYSRLMADRTFFLFLKQISPKLTEKLFFKLKDMPASKLQGKNFSIEHSRIALSQGNNF